MADQHTRISTPEPAIKSHLQRARLCWDSWWPFLAHQAAPLLSPAPPYTRRPDPHTVPSPEAADSYVAQAQIVISPPVPMVLQSDSDPHSHWNSLGNYNWGTRAGSTGSNKLQQWAFEGIQGEVQLPHLDCRDSNHVSIRIYPGSTSHVRRRNKQPLQALITRYSYSGAVTAVLPTPSFSYCQLVRATLPSLIGLLKLYPNFRGSSKRMPQLICNSTSCSAKVGWGHAGTAPSPLGGQHNHCARVV